MLPYAQNINASHELKLLHRMLLYYIEMYFRLQSLRILGVHQRSPDVHIQQVQSVHKQAQIKIRIMYYEAP